MPAQPVNKPSRFTAVLALFVFVVIGILFAEPCLCLPGAIAGGYKSSLFALMILRLAWSIYRRTFSFRDYIIYFVILIGFCLWADSHIHNL